MRHRRWTAWTIIGCGLFLGSSWIRSQAGLHSGAEPREPQRLDGDFRLMGAYCNLRDYRVALLLNNKGPDPLYVNMRVFAIDGSGFEADPVEVPGGASIDLNLEKHLRGSPRKFRVTSLELEYSGHFLELGAQLRHFDRHGRGGFSEQLSRPEEFVSARLRGNWGGLEKRGRLRLALANMSQKPLTARVEAEGVRNAGRLAEVSLKARQLRLIELKPSDELGRLDFEHDGEPGDLVIQGILTDASSMPRSLVQFSDPGRAGTKRLHGVGLRLSPSHDPVLALANHSKQDAEVSIAASTVGDSEPDIVALANLHLKARGSKDFGPELRQAVSETLGFGASRIMALKIEYSTPAGSVTGQALSPGRPERLLHQVPLRDPKSHFSSAGTYPWDLGSGKRTVFYVHNMSDKPQRHHWYLTHQGEPVFASGFRVIQPDEAVALDVGRIRDEQREDRGGRMIPAGAERGQVHWSMLGSGLALDARVEHIDPVAGTVHSYQCEDCCNNTVHTELFPNSIQARVGDAPVNLVATQTPQDCNGNDGVREEVEISHIWFDQPGDVVTVSGNTVFCIGPGSTSLQVFVPLPFLAGAGEPNPLCEEIQPEETEAEFHLPVQVDPIVNITGPSGISVGNPSVHLQTSTNPAGGTLSNWRITSGDGNCVELKSNGTIRAFAPGTVGVRVDYAASGRTAASPEFQVSLGRTPQYVTFAYTAQALAILGTHFNAADVARIQQRAEGVINLLFAQRAGANVVVGPPPSGTAWVTIRVEGAGTGGHCGFDLMNRSRGGLCTIHIGPGSLDVANVNDPVGATPVNERMSVDRVGDAIGRLAAHELGHAVGLVAQAAELAGNGLAAKLNVQALLRGTATHHRANGGAGAFIMFATTDVSNERSWNRTLFDFDGNEDRYLDRILP